MGKSGLDVYLEQLFEHGKVWRMSANYGLYDFEKFIEEVKDKDYIDMIRYAEIEANRADSRSYGVKGAVRARKEGSTVYVRQIGEFLFWLRNGARPAGASERDFQLYRIVAENLIAKKQFKLESLDLFGNN